MSPLAFALICGAVVVTVALSALAVDRAGVWEKLIDENRMFRWFLAACVATVTLTAAAWLLGASEGVLIGIGVAGGTIMAIAARFWGIGVSSRRKDG